ncbi:MAG: 50S ribosomal protein L10 [Euryarchaeota archaeon]|nr:50S ribosomal protein L10 [Euryarchaeota archaeon]
MRTRRWKEEEVKRLKKMVQDARVVALAGLRDLPASHLQEIRAETVRRGGQVKVAKNSLLRRALQSKHKELADAVADQSVLLTSTENPFKFFKAIESTQRKAPLRGGAVAPMDIIVPAGPTPFRPGTVLAELQAAGIPAAVESGKVVVRKDVVVVKAGQKVGPNVASLLAQMEIRPVEQGLRVRGIWEEGTFYLPEVLRIDEGKVLADLQMAARGALGLAVEIAYPTPQSIEALLVRAHREARGLAIEAPVYEKGVISDILARAQREAQALAAAAPQASPASKS